LLAEVGNRYRWPSGFTRSGAGQTPKGSRFRKFRERSERAIRVALTRKRRRNDRGHRCGESEGDTLGGIFESRNRAAIGLRQHAQWDRKLDANIARALMSIQAIKGVENPASAFEAARRFGSQSMTKSCRRKPGVLTRASNNAGGFEGRHENASACGPRRDETALDVDEAHAFRGHQDAGRSEGTVERSDVCAAARRGGDWEAVVAIELAVALPRQIRGDSVAE